MMPANSRWDLIQGLKGYYYVLHSCSVFDLITVINHEFNNKTPISSIVTETWDFFISFELRSYFLKIRVLWSTHTRPANNLNSETKAFILGFFRFFLSLAVEFLAYPGRICGAPLAVLRQRPVSWHGRCKSAFVYSTETREVSSDGRQDLWG
jgi:hypothetical protein